jgi:hypothetical protein
VKDVNSPWLHPDRQTADANKRKPYLEYQDCHYQQSPVAELSEQGFECCLAS